MISDFCHLSVAGQSAHLSVAIQTLMSRTTQPATNVLSEKKIHLSQISYERQTPRRGALWTVMISSVGQQ